MKHCNKGPLSVTIIQCLYKGSCYPLFKDQLPSNFDLLNNTFTLSRSIWSRKIPYALKKMTSEAFLHKIGAGKRFEC